MALWDIKSQVPACPPGDSWWRRTEPRHPLRLAPADRTDPPGVPRLPRREGRKAKALGYRAAKLEVCVNGPYSHNGLQEDDDAVVEIVAECRRAVGAGMVLMVDVAYAWPDAASAVR